MKLNKLWLIVILLTAAVAVHAAAAVPSQITYQGSLKEKGVPVSGSRTMLFRLTNQDGSTVYWSSGNQSVQVTQGLFSVVLSPAGVDWQSVSPYIEISVNGQLLLPRDPLTSTVYSQISGTVVDGGITAAKLASQAVGTDQIADGAVTSAKLASASATSLVPAGTILLFAGASTPAGYLSCDGSAVSRTTYAALFQAVGTVWGPGDGNTTFNLPDLRGRTAIGAGQGSGLTNRVLGQTIGEETHTLTLSEMPSHTHGVNDPGHSHSVNDPGHSHGITDPGHSHDIPDALVQNGGNKDISAGNEKQMNFNQSTSNVKTGISVNASTTGISIIANTTGISLQNTGGSQPHNIMQPSAVMGFVIKY